MTAIVKLQKTGYYVNDADGHSWQDGEGHGWFTKAIAAQHARAIGGMYYDGNRTSLKEVVTGYTTPDPADPATRGWVRVGPGA